MPESEEAPENRNVIGQITVTATGVVGHGPAPIEGESA